MKAKLATLPKDFLVIKPQDLFELCKDKSFRHSLNAELIAFELRTQIRKMREARNWTQAELAERIGTKQAEISRLENMTPERFPRIRTLQRVADVFDVALLVRFGNWGEILNRIASMQKQGVDIPVEFSKLDWTSYFQPAI